MVGPTRMELIACKRERHRRFLTRATSMKKKAFQLSTLCGIEVGMIICSPSGKEIETLSWSNKQEDDGKTLIDLITTYKNQDGKRKRTVNGISISKKETQKKAAAACELDVNKSKLEVVMSENELQDDSIQDYGTADDDEDFVFELNQMLEERVTPILEDSTFASNSDPSCHSSNVPSVITTGGYPMTTSQVLIGRAAFQDSTYLHDDAQSSYIPYPY